MTTHPVPASRATPSSAPETAGEEALKRSEARDRALAEASSQAVWSWDPATGLGDFEATQRWWEQITGQDPAGQSGKGWSGWLVAYRCPTAPPWPLTYASDGVLALTGRPSEDFRNPLAPIRNAAEVLRRIGPDDHLHLRQARGMIDRQVALHGGEVEAASGGRGSRFTVRLPLSRETEDAAESTSVASPEVKSLRVLVVEDNRDAAESLGMLLELSGHCVELAYAGQEGLDAARRFRPDVVVCDIGLPGGMDGYDLARSLRASDEVAGAYLIALSGYGQDEDKRRAREAGFDQHLTKPVDPGVLMRLLEGLPMNATDALDL